MDKGFKQFSFNLRYAGDVIERPELHRLLGLLEHGESPDSPATVCLVKRSKKMLVFECPLAEPNNNEESWD
jgi:hypothetical protein